MYTTIEKVNGISDVTNTNESCWFIMHTDTELKFYGKHIGQLTLKVGVIECTHSEIDMLERIAELGFEVDNAE